MVHEENWKLIFDALEPVGSLTTSSTITKIVKSLLSFERFTSCQLKDSLPLHEPWHSDLPNFLRLVIIIRPPYYQNNDTIFLNITFCKMLIQMRRSLHLQVVINILRPDKMSELLDAFISDHLGWLSLPSRCLQDSLPDVCKRVVINL